MKYLGAAAALLLILAQGSTAQAGVYTDDMAKCLVKSTTPQDQIAFIQWIFSAMASHPAVQPYAKISDTQRHEIDEKGSALLQRLLTVDCRAEVVAALKYEGPSSIEGGFTVLGQVAMRGLMNDPHVAQSLGNMGNGVDEAKMKELFKEAGLQDTAPAASGTPGSK